MQQSNKKFGFFCFLSGLTIAVFLGSKPGLTNPPSRLSAEFTMTRTMKVLSGSIESKGKLVLGGEGLLRWEMTAPTRSILVINKTSAWISYPDMNVTKSFDLGKDPLMNVLSVHLLALTRGDFEKMGEFYESTSLENGVTRLVPKQDSIRQVFSELRVSMGDDKVMKWVELFSANGDSTKIAFHKISTNPDIDNAMFENPEN